MSKLNTVQNGKGSKPRVTDLEKFRENYDTINWKKKIDLSTKTEPISSGCSSPDEWSTNS